MPYCQKPRDLSVGLFCVCARCQCSWYIQNQEISLQIHLAGIRNRTKLREMLCAKTTVIEAFELSDPIVIFKSLRLAWISRLLNDNWRNCDRVMEIYTNLLLPKTRGSTVLIFFFAVITTPNFWRNPIFHRFIRRSKQIFSNLRHCINVTMAKIWLTLFNNKDILIDGKTFFLTKMEGERNCRHSWYRRQPWKAAVFWSLSNKILHYI